MKKKEKKKLGLVGHPAVNLSKQLQQPPALYKIILSSFLFVFFFFTGPPFNA